jgi:hypothetical protein
MLAGVITVLLTLALAVSARGADLAPAPSLDPADVVRIQVEALAGNGADDAGIAFTFRFASPDNRRQTGPLERFAAMVKGPAYRSMLNHTRASYEPVERSGDVARQVVRVLGRDGQWVTYGFVLRRQERAPYEDCWMTEAVLRLEEGGLRQAASGASPAAHPGKARPLAGEGSAAQPLAGESPAAGPLPGRRPPPRADVVRQTGAAMLARIHGPAPMDSRERASHPGRATGRVGASV